MHGIRRVKDGSRVTIIGVTRDIRMIPYAEGTKTRMQFDVEDSTGVITAVAWDDAYASFATIQENMTYKFCGVKVMANSQQHGRLEIKLYDNTIVEQHAHMTIEHTYVDISAVRAGEPLHIRAIVGEIHEHDGQHRLTLVDKTGDLLAFLRSTVDLVALGIKIGDIVAAHGRASNEGTDRIFVHTVEKTDDDSLANFWTEEKDNVVFKRQKLAEAVVVKKIVDIKELAPGTRCSVEGVVRSCSVKPIPLENKTEGKPDRVKHTMSIVDDSCSAISVGVFCDKGAPFEVKIGSVVALQASVSTYWGCSLTCNSVATIDNAALAKWWTTAPETFEEVSACI